MRSIADALSTELPWRERWEVASLRKIKMLGEDKDNNGKGVTGMGVGEGGSCGAGDKTLNPHQPVQVGAGQEVEESPPTSQMRK